MNKYMLKTLCLAEFTRKDKPGIQPHDSNLIRQF